MNLIERLYLVEIGRGLLVTLKHLVRNILRPSKMMTLLYPEQKHTLPPNYRAEHRLMHREDGTPRCTACQLCETICPAHCIRIKPTESPNPQVEKVPKAFDIDILRCVFCGFCVEACPCDAIRMDTGKYENASFTGPKLVYDIKYLMNNHPDGMDKVSKAIY